MRQIYSQMAGQTDRQQELAGRQEERQAGRHRNIFIVIVLYNKSRNYIQEVGFV